MEPRLAASVKELGRKLAQLCAGRDLDNQTVHDATDLYERHRTVARLRDIDFPEMVLVVLDVQKKLRFVRRDLDERGIDNLVVELAQMQGSNYDPAEIARGVRRAFPSHRAPDPRDRKSYG